MIIIVDDFLPGDLIRDAATDVEAVGHGDMLDGASHEASSSKYWLASIKRQGISPHHPNGVDYQVFRNVKDYGARGDGVHDDTDAINRAINEGVRFGRDGQDDSSTISPAIVYFPTVGDAVTRPTIKARFGFRGLAVIDENPYMAGGRNWYTNQNNFFRSVAHLVIDLSDVSSSVECAGIHHQVAQATGLRHVHFEMRVWTEGNSIHRGIFMENGSGGYMSDLSFRGGTIGAWLGNQQFTVQNCVFESCHKAISQHWNWTFLYHKIRISRCTVGMEIHAPSVSSVTCVDWTIRDTLIGFDIVSPHSPEKVSVILSNVAVDRTGHVVRRSLSDSPPRSLLPIDPSDRAKGKAKSINWIWEGDDDPSPAGRDTVLPRSSRCLDAAGQWCHKSRPEYLHLSAADFISARDFGAAGDGCTDDSKALQRLFDLPSTRDKVVYIPHGHYRLTQTLVIPPRTRIVGEVWPVLYGEGPFFNDADNPRPVIQVGSHEGQEGTVEISECIFSTSGPSKGAIVLLWNMRRPEESSNASADMPGMWDTHIRLGGFAGSQQIDSRFDGSVQRPLKMENNEAASTCFLAWHVPRLSSGCFVNNWVWLADHILDGQVGRPAGQQISLPGGRGILIESNPGPVWLWGGASEHFLLYQYQLNKAKNVFIGHSQTESPYFLGSGCEAHCDQLAPPNPRWHDPSWQVGSGDEDQSVAGFHRRSWGIRVLNSTHVHLYGPSLYSFFDAYSQEKLDARRCQRALFQIVPRGGRTEEGQEPQTDIGVVIVNLNTVGTKSMLDVGSYEVIQEAGHRNGFVNTFGFLHVGGPGSALGT